MTHRRHKVSTFGETKRLLGKGDEFPELILFREKLYVFDENGKRIGRFSINVEENSDDSPIRVFYVHLSNRAFINGNLNESTVTGTVTNKLRTLEEIRYERHLKALNIIAKPAFVLRTVLVFCCFIYIELCSEVPNSGKHERCLFLLRETTKYYLSITNMICDLKNHTRAVIPFTKAIGLIGESANAILLRKLAIEGYEGILCLKAVLSNGRRCKNYYVSKLSEEKINGKRMQVMIVYRIMTNHRKCNVTMTLALTRAGQLVYLFWSNSRCFLHIDPNFEVNTRRFAYGEPGLQNRWHKDFQLHSLYLDNVDHQLFWVRSFKYQNDELRRILGDFVQYVLLVKPEDIICFAINFFSAFSRGSLRKCQSETYHQKDIKDLLDYRVYPEWEGEDFLRWPNEGECFGEF